MPDVCGFEGELVDCARRVALVWGWFAHIDTVAIAQGKIIPGDRVKVIQPLEIGVIRAIHVRDGQAVKKDEVLIELDPTDSGADLVRLEHSLVSRRLDAARLTAMAENPDDPLSVFVAPPDTPAPMLSAARTLMRAEAQLRERVVGTSSVRAQIDAYRDTIPLIQKRVDAWEYLTKKEYASRLRLTELQEQLVTRQRSLIVEQRRLSEIAEAISVLRRRKAERTAALAGRLSRELSEAMSEAVQYEQELNKVRERLRREPGGTADGRRPRRCDAGSGGNGAEQGYRLCPRRPGIRDQDRELSVHQVRPDRRGSKAYLRRRGGGRKAGAGLSDEGDPENQPYPCRRPLGAAGARHVGHRRGQDGQAPRHRILPVAPDALSGRGAANVSEGPAAAGAPAAVPAARQPSPVAGILGEAVWLFGRSNAHKHLFISELDWLLVPALQLRQFRIWRHNGQPVGFASWAWLTQEAAARVVESARAGRMGRIAPNEWKSGDQLWLIDFLAPFGGGDEMVKELREKIFAGQKIKTLQPAPDGSGPAVTEW